MGYLMTLKSLTCIMLNHRDIDELLEVVMAYSVYYSRICLKGLRKREKGQNIRYPRRDSTPSECKSRMLPLDEPVLLTHS
jgi:hypothetical protein